jgi:hypothetical protein
VTTHIGSWLSILELFFHPVHGFHLDLGLSGEYETSLVVVLTGDAMYGIAVVWFVASDRVVLWCQLRMKKSEKDEQTLTQIYR